MAYTYPSEKKSNNKPVPPVTTPEDPTKSETKKDLVYFGIGFGLIVFTVLWCLASPIIIKKLIPGIGDVAMWFTSALLYITCIGIINFCFLRDVKTSGHGVGAFLIFVCMIIIYAVRAFNTDSGDSKPQRDWKTYNKGFYYLSSYHTGPMMDHWIHKQKEETFDIKWDNRKYNHFFIKTRSGKIIYPEDLRGGKVVFSDEDIMFFNEYDEEQIISLQIR